MKQRTKAIIATLTLSLMLPFMMIPASANSALTEWSGRKENVVMTTDGDSPIVVEHETLTFDIQELIDTYSRSDDEFDPTKEYKSSVTAEYHFYNPSDMTVTAELAFPIGNLTESYINEYAKDKYSITVNGETVEHEIRHTYNWYTDRFDLEKDLPRLKDDYVTHEFITPDTKVTKYEFQVELVNENDASTPRMYFDINPADYENTMIYCPVSYYNQLDDGTVRITRNHLRRVEIYFIGEVPEKLPEFTVFKDVFNSDENEILPSKSAVTGIKEMTFRDVAFRAYKEEYGISEMDWYNAVMIGASNKNKVIDDDFIILQPRDFLCWYTYKLEFAPGERIVNSVTAPMIPGQNLNYNPKHFKYNYLISPAVTWADFGSMDIYINTPYYLVSSNIDGFEKTENGYEIHLDGLPMTKKRLDISWDEIKIAEPEVKDLYFSLCESDSPQKKASKSTIGIILLIIFSPIILVIWIVNLCIQGVKRAFAK